MALRPKTCVLTIDDAPSPSSGDRILNILHDEEVVAEFFVVGKNLSANAGTIKRIVKEGHRLQNHTWSHVDLTQLCPLKIRREIGATQREIRVLGMQRAEYLRCPWGRSNDVIEQIAQTLGLQVLRWDVDIGGYGPEGGEFRLNVEEAIGRLAALERKGQRKTIILAHDKEGFARQGQAFIRIMKRRGYSFIGLREYCHGRNGRT